MAATFSVGERWRFGLIAAVWAVDLALLPFAPFAVVWTSFAPIVLLVAVLSLAALIYMRLRPDPRLAQAARATAEMMVFAVGTCLLNYLGFMAGRPLFDADLAAADGLIGFHWPSFVAWLASLPHVDTVLHAAYNSSLVQVAAIVAFLAMSGRDARLDRFLLAFMFAAVITIAVWTVFPSFGAYAYYVSLGTPVSSAGLSVDPAYAQRLLAMHAGHLPPFRFDRIVGLIGFPSFHTCVAVLCAVTLLGVRWLGPLAFAINVLMLLSVPAQGGHHLTDVFGGFVTTGVAMALAHHVLEPRRSAMPVGALVRRIASPIFSGAAT